jgi:hypothetical protein
MSERAREDASPQPADRSAQLAVPAAETRSLRLLALQSTAGNRAVGRLLARVPSQVNINRPERRTGGRSYSGRARYEVDFTPLECMLTIRVRLVPDANVTQVQTDAVKAETEREFLRLWDNKFYLDETVTGRLPFIDPRATSTERFFLRVRVLFVNSGQHVRVRLSRGPGRNNETHWYATGSIAMARAHELSHTLGLNDEYIDSSVPRRRNATAPGVFDDHSLLGNYYTEGVANAEVKLRHGQQLAADISRATRRRFTAHYSGNYQGERLVRWRAIRDAAAAGSAERTRAEAEVRSIEQDLLIPMLSGAGTTP